MKNIFDDDQLDKILKEVNLDDVEDGDLVRVEEDSATEEKAYSIVATWNW